ncbi:hypothetical protein C9I98_19585 [Photobacterium sanctipauli]|uniref:Uncharacterized protein n=2 Tax=Photobacterium sanctipauli TaxID=1342794 RepID=A0A2T3NNI7_9GAMM|nr:hypothetical protein [Photobacterium sanctipauli]PSW17211.1 hypothetical protein C9I98_19585 [Photobacterium sanctipauli]
MLNAFLFLLVLAFGAEKYLIYSDSHGLFTQGNQALFFGWEQFRLLPIQALSKPVLITGDYTTVLPPPADHLPQLIERYPYQTGFEPYYSLFYLYTLLSVVLVLSKHKDIDKKWNEAKSNDTVAGYKLFIHWSEANFIRRMYTTKERQQAVDAYQSIKQRAILKLDTYQSAFSHSGLKPVFLNIVQALAKEKCESLKLDVKYNGNNHHLFNVDEFYSSPKDKGFEFKEDISELPEKILPDMLTDTASKMDLLMDYSKRLLDEYPYYRLGTGISMLGYAKPHTFIHLPNIEYAEKSVRNALDEALQEGVRKFAGQELLSIKDKNEGAVLSVDFNCFVYSPFHIMCKPKHWKRTAGFSAGAGYKELIVDGKAYPGAANASTTLGMLFSWQLIVRGKTILEGKQYALPDDTFIYKTSNIGPEIESFDSRDKGFFDANAISNVNSLFAQLMGIDVNTINNTELRLDKTSAKVLEQSESQLSQLSHQLETALKDESLSELLNTSSKELYLSNKALFDSYIADFIQNTDQQENLRYIAENYADLIPISDIAEEVLNIALEATENA